jgi:hypothetical protein
MRQALEMKRMRTKRTPSGAARCVDNFVFAFNSVGVEHLKVHEVDRQLAIDLSFLGKDSIKYENRVMVPIHNPPPLKKSDRKRPPRQTHVRDSLREPKALHER